MLLRRLSMAFKATMWSEGRCRAKSTFAKAPKPRREDEGGREGREEGGGGREEGGGEEEGWEGGGGVEVGRSSKSLIVSLLVKRDRIKLF